MSRLSSPPPEQPGDASPTVSKEPDVTILDSRLPKLGKDEPAGRQNQNHQPNAQPGVSQASAQLDRDPMARLEALFDPGSVQLLLPQDASGILAGEGLIDGVTAVAFASDPRIQGGA